MKKFFIEATKIILILTGVIWLFYDLIAFAAGGPSATLSYVIWTSARKFVFIPYAFGVLMSHFFLPDFFKNKIPKLRYKILTIISITMLIISLFIYPANLSATVFFFTGLVTGLLWAQTKIKE